MGSGVRRSPLDYLDLLFCRPSGTPCSFLLAPGTHVPGWVLPRLRRSFATTQKTFKSRFLAALGMTIVCRYSVLSDRYSVLGTRNSELCTRYSLLGTSSHRRLQHCGVELGSDQSRVGDHKTPVDAGRGRVRVAGDEEDRDVWTNRTQTANQGI